MNASFIGSVLAFLTQGMISKAVCNLSQELVQFVWYWTKQWTLTCEKRKGTAPNLSCLLWEWGAEGPCWAPAVPAGLCQCIPRAAGHGWDLGTCPCCRWAVLPCSCPWVPKLFPGFPRLPLAACSNEFYSSLRFWRKVGLYWDYFTLSFLSPENSQNLSDTERCFSWQVCVYFVICPCEGSAAVWKVSF